MTGSNEYVFIIIPTSYYPLYTWKAEPEDELFYEPSQKSRDEDAKKAFQVRGEFAEPFNHNAMHWYFAMTAIE